MHLPAAILPKWRTRLAARFASWSHRLAPPLAATQARSPQERAALQAWREVKGDLTLRLDYALTPEDQVVDVGGYQGQWASDIHARYRCPVFIFEPIPEFAQFIARRFATNPSLHVMDYGLGANEAEAPISIAADASSICSAAETGCLVRIKSAAKVFNALSLKEIALLKLNIEGAEYDLLEHLIATAWIKAIRDVQVQFHSFVPNAIARRAEIRRLLATTHELTYDYPFVWENWRRCGSID
jgi:FkbM family methyltransferase